MRRALVLGTALLALSCSLAHAGSKPAPIAASSVQAFTRDHVVKRWELLPLTTIAGYLSSVAGRTVAISCDEPGVPGPDGNTLDSKVDDGEVFWNGSSFGPFIHVTVSECLGAQRVLRARDRDPVSWDLYRGRRIDSISGPALEVMLHEAIHIGLQSTDEGLVECTAYRNAWALVRLLRLSSWDADLVLRGMAWRHDDGQPQYHTYC